MHYSRLKSWVAGVFPYASVLLCLFLLFCPSPSLFSSSGLLASLTFISVLSLRVFPSSARVQRRLCSVLPLLLTCGVPAKWPVRQLSGFHEWPLFGESTAVHQTCPGHTGLCIAEGSLVIFALRFCPPVPVIRHPTPPLLPSKPAMLFTLPGLPV